MLHDARVGHTTITWEMGGRKFHGHAIGCRIGPSGPVRVSAGREGPALHSEMEVLHGEVSGHPQRLLPSRADGDNFERACDFAFERV